MITPSTTIFTSGPHECWVQEDGWDFSPQLTCPTASRTLPQHSAEHSSCETHGFLFPGLLLETDAHRRQLQKGIGRHRGPRAPPQTCSLVRHLPDSSG